MLLVLLERGLSRREADPGPEPVRTPKTPSLSTDSTAMSLPLLGVTRPLSYDMVDLGMVAGVQSGQSERSAIMRV